MDVGDGVGASGVLDDQVVDADILALLEADSEVRPWQRAKIVTDFGVLPRHVDDHRAVGQLPEVLVLVGLQHAHKAKVLGRDLVVEVALQDGVRHLVAEDDKATAASAKEGLHAAFDILIYAFVVLVEDDQHRVNTLKIWHFGHRLLGEILL